MVVTVLLRMLDGEAANREITVRHFPFTVGRAGDADLRLVRAGVWETHFSLLSESGSGIRLVATEGATTRVNGATVSETRLRPGDVIEAGGARLQFWLGAVRQKALRGGEWLVWAGLAVFVIIEIFLLGYLPR